MQITRHTFQWFHTAEWEWKKNKERKKKKKKKQREGKDNLIYIMDRHCTHACWCPLIERAKVKPAVDSLFSITFSFCFFISLSLQQNQNTNTNTYRERERDGCCSRGSDIGRVSSVSIWLSSTWKPILATRCGLSPPQAPPFQNPYGIFLSLFFNFIVLCPIYYYNRSGFSLIWGVQTFFMVNYSIFMYL